MSTLPDEWTFQPFADYKVENDPILNHSSREEETPSHTVESPFGSRVYLTMVDTIAQLAQLSTTNYNRCLVLGYYAAGDHGGGEYWYDETASSTLGNGGTLIPSTFTGIGCWRLVTRGAVSVRQFGAKGDGVADDTPKIQAALDWVDAQGGGEVYVPSGIYSIMAPEANYLWLTSSSHRRNYAGLFIGSNTLLRGAGTSAVLRLAGTPPSPDTTDGRGDYSTTHIVVNKGAQGLPRTIVNRDITVRDLKFDGNYVQQSGEGVSFCSVERFLITGCDFTNSYYETNYIVFCRGGEIVHNRMYGNGVYQIDGGGPMADTSTDITIAHNMISDSGYYAVLLIDAWNCRCVGNHIYKESYANASGYQAIRVANCSMSTIADNLIQDSAYSAIWNHGGYNNTLSGNTIIHAGYGAGAGSNLHGISVDYSTRGGRHIVKGNKVFLCQGAGIAILEGITNGVITQDNAGTVVSDNIVMFNNRDGIAIYGQNHTIQNNIVEANGLSIDTEIVGDGYNGITLNGAQYCLVSGNSCQNPLQASSLPLNLAAYANLPFGSQYTVLNPKRTQNYGIVEYPGGIDGVTPANNNQIMNNNVRNNLSNAQGGSGYHAYNSATIHCGVNSTVSSNIGQ